MNDFHLATKRKKGPLGCTRYCLGAVPSRNTIEKNIVSQVPGVGRGCQPRDIWDSGPLFVSPSLPRANSARTRARPGFRPPNPPCFR